jgi:hypothetical protein
VTVLLVFFKLALVIVSLFIPPGAFALPQALAKVAFILRTILPSVLSIPVRVPVAVHSFVGVSVLEVLVAFTLFYKFAEKTCK